MIQNTVMQQSADAVWVYGLGAIALIAVSAVLLGVAMRVCGRHPV